MSGLRSDFEARGFLPALPVLDDSALAYLRNLAFADARTADANRAKALWQLDPRVLEVARSARVTGALDSLFAGKGYFLWGAQVIDQEPGQAHQWHCDIETAREGFISLWIGIEGISSENCLRVITGSHLLDEPLQAEFSWEDPARTDPEGVRLAAHVRSQGGQGDVAQADCVAGKGIFFHGRLWHGTFHQGGGRRRSLLLQFGRHGVPVRHYLDRKKYPFEYDEVRLPRVLSLAGTPDPLTNKTLMVDDTGKLGAPVALTHAAPRLVAIEGEGWTRHPYFDTATPIMQRFRCHASVLGGGVMPHLPHQHEDEELLIVLDGSAGIVTPLDASGQWQVQPAEAGDVFYYPGGYAHTITNHSLGADAEPLAYLMFRWKTRAAAIKEAPPFRIPARAVRGKERLMVDRPSSRLAKIHVHTTELEPGQRFPRDIDCYDSTFVVLRGELSVMDQTLGPGGVFLTRAGELHDTVNLGAEPCKYLVFEFHHESPGVPVPRTGGGR